LLLVIFKHYPPPHRKQKGFFPFFTQRHLPRNSSSPFLGSRFLLVPCGLYGHGLRFIVPNSTTNTFFLRIPFRWSCELGVLFSIYGAPHGVIFLLGRLGSSFPCLNNIPYTIRHHLRATRHLVSPEGPVTSVVCRVTFVPPLPPLFIRRRSVSFFFLGFTPSL